MLKIITIKNIKIVVPGKIDKQVSQKQLASRSNQVCHNDGSTKS